MAITIYDDGWSRALQYNGGDPTNDGNYENNTNPTSGRDATWFQRSWWDGWNNNPKSWARKFVNRADTALRITQMSFLACAGHSNGKQYNGGGGLVGPSNGYGCTFGVSIYVKGGESATAASTATVNSIYEYNCYYGGYGNVSTGDQNTSFGDITLFAGTGRERQKRVFNFVEAPPVPPGGEMFLHVRPVSWASGSTLSNSLLVIQSYDPFFESTFENVNNPYIWRMMENGHWEKVYYAYKWTGTEWLKMEGTRTSK